MGKRRHKRRKQTRPRRQGYKVGGKLEGPSHEEGGIPIEVEGGEYIIKKSSVNAATKPVLESINKTGKLPSESGYNYQTIDARKRR
jgi:hypothetical protein